MLLPIEKVGLIGRDTNERDARVSLVKLTDSGEKLYQEATVTLAQKAGAVFGDLSEMQAQVLFTTLKSI